MSFEKFRILMWKNYIIQKRCYILGSLEVIFPVLIVIILTSILGFFDSNENEWQPSDESTASLDEFRIISYSPNSPWIEEFVTNAFNETHPTFQPFDNAKALDEFLHKEISTNILGIEFDDSLKALNDPPSQLSYTLRFPNVSESSVQSNRVVVTQNRLDKTFIRIFSDATLPEIEAISYRTHNDNRSYLMQLLKTYLPVTLVLTTLFAAAKIIKNVAIERESRLKETMRIMGLSNTVHWTTWLVSSLLIPMGTYTLVTVFLCCKIINDCPILSNSNFFLVWIFFVFYVVATITFCFLMSVIFQDSTSAVTLGVILFVLTVTFHSLFESDFKSFNYAVKLLYCLPINSGLGQGISMILQFEQSGEGLQMTNFASHENELKFSIAEVLFSFVIASIVHMLLTVYIEHVFTGNIGIPRPWYFPISMALQHFRRKPLVTDTDNVKKTTKLDSQDHEADPQHLTVGVQIVDLTKMFGAVTVVNRFSLKIFEDQITVLLGHNGCGKTTTLSMLTGLLPPTSGTAFLNKHDIRTETSKARSSLGLCPQHDILIDDLTVHENLIFFCQLKGVSKKSIDDEIAKFANALNFTDKLNSLSKNLSGGQKRKLSICIALSGGSKVVMLDEPTAGLDAGARRSLWNLLIHEKKGRTIVLTTHYMDEADVLGDRIAIMSHGELQTVGSPFFLKKRFGSGYKLICVKNHGCDSSHILNILQQFVPDAHLKSDDRTESVFVLSEEHVSAYPNMFKKIEVLSASLKIASFGLSVTSLEEVFFKVGSDKSGGDSHTERIRFNDFVPTRKVSGFTLVLYQIYAMIFKQFHYTRRNFYAIGLWLLITVAFIVAFLAAGNHLVGSYDDSEDNSNIAMKVIVSYDSSNPSVFENIVNLLEEKAVVEDVDSVENHLFHRYSMSKHANKSLLVLSIKSDNTAWVPDDDRYHEILITNTIHRALLKSVAGNQYDITNAGASNPETIRPKRKEEDYSTEQWLMFGMLYLFSCYWPTVFIAIKVKERAMRTKLLQFISGANRFVYWFTSVAIDCLSLLVIMYIIIGSLALKQRPYFKPIEELVVFLCNGFSTVTFIYMTTFLFATPATAVLIVFSHGLIFCTVMYLLYIMLYRFVDKTETLARAFYWILLNFAPFSLLDCITKRSYPTILTGEEATHPDSHRVFHFGETGIGANIVVMVVSGILFLSICLLLDHSVFQQVMNRTEYNRMNCATKTVVDNDVDNDVDDEIRKVKRMSHSELIQTSLVLQGLSKWYGKSMAVKQLYLGVEKSECVGLLGVNGAGKTTTFKMLTGDESISSGDVRIRGKSMQSNMIAAQKSVGYCPQFDALMFDISGRENLKIFSLIRGIPWNEINEIIEKISKAFGFYVHLDKKVKNYSGGNKRKISAALSMLGDPDLILLDEPTTGIDPYSKRQLWTAVNKARDSGKSVILTSHSMEECEALCTRIAIMAAGEFKCMGSVQHLKNKFCKGFNVTVKLNWDDESELQRVKSLVEQLFTTAQFTEKYLDMVTFRILTEKLDWGEMFGTMTHLKSEKTINDFTLNQMSLEEVFLHFANKEQENIV